MKPSPGQLNLFGPQLTGRDVYGQPPEPDLRLNASVQPADVSRLKASARRLYDAMRGGEWFTTTQLEAIGGRSAPQRVNEFRAAGFDYESVPIPGGRGEHRWRLIGGPRSPGRAPESLNSQES